MTETTTAPPPPEAAPPPSPPLVRPLDGRVFRGVCAALGRATGTDPVLWRVLVVVLAFFGGSGLVLYLAGWLLLPDEGAEQSPGQRLLGAERPVATLVLVAAAVIALLVVVDGDGDGVVPLLVIAAVGYLVLRARQDRPEPSAGWSAPPAWTTGAGPLHGPSPAPVPPRAPRPRSNLGALTVSATVLVVGLLWLADALGADGVTATRVLAAALLVVGGGLVVGARWGRARGLIALAVVLALALAFTSSVDRRFGTSSGDVTWVVDGSTERELGVGEAVLDLRPLAGTSRTVDVSAEVGAGELLVLVPEDLRVDLDAHVGLGALRISEDGEVVREQDGGGLDEQASLGPPGPRRVALEVELGLGELEVRRVAAQ